MNEINYFKPFCFYGYVYIFILKHNKDIGGLLANKKFGLLSVSHISLMSWTFDGVKHGVK